MSFLGQLAAGFAQTHASGLYGQRERQAEDAQQQERKALIAQRAAELLRNEMLDRERMKDADQRLGLEQLRITQGGTNAANRLTAQEQAAADKAVAQKAAAAFYAGGAQGTPPPAEGIVLGRAAAKGRISAALRPPRASRTGTDPNLHNVTVVGKQITDTGRDLGAARRAQESGMTEADSVLGARVPALQARYDSLSTVRDRLAGTMQGGSVPRGRPAPGPAPAAPPDQLILQVDSEHPDWTDAQVFAEAQRRMRAPH